MGWTRQQEQAINLNNCNLLVSAAAGSGKTAVLTQRIVNKVSTDIDVDRLLIITFTKAAAAEMRQRISSAIADRLDKGEGNIERLIRQQALMSKSNISTIDSFCKQVVMKNFTISNVDSSFSIGDEDELNLLQQEIFDDMLEVYYLEADPAFEILADYFSDKSSDDSLQSAIIQIYNFMFTLPDPFDWLKEAVDMYSCETAEAFSCTGWYRELIKHAINVSFDCKKEVEHLIDVSHNYPIPAMTKAFTNDLPVCEALYEFLTENERSWDEISAYLKNLKFPTRPKVSDEDDRETVAVFEKYRNKIKDEVSKLSKVFSGPVDFPLEQIRQTRPCMEMLYRLILDFHNRFTAAKAQRHLLSFSDIEHLALKVLSVPEIAHEYRSRFVEIYVDEYQDTNMLQEAIINAISSENNVFMVGDVKQSIYAFRQACPELFTEKEECFAKPENYTDNSPGCVVKLASNFRSRKQVVDSVNNVFCHIMNKTTCNIDYTEEDALHYSAEYFDAVDTGADYTSEILVCNGKIEDEFSMIGREIRKLVDGKFPVYDKETKQLRSIRFSDVAILLRKVGDRASAMVKCLQSQGVPCFAEEKGGFFEDYDVNVILSTVRIIDNPLQDIPLLTVLRSPVFNFDENTLAEIRMNDRNAFLFESMLTMKNEKVTGFLNKYEDLKEKSESMSISGFIWMLITETGYYDYVGNSVAGSRRQANLRLLFDRAVEYENTGKRSFFRFINHIERLRKKDDSSETASDSSEGMDAVSVMTIHKSKGLEYPVVFVARCGDKLSGGNNSKPSFQLSRQLGITMKLYNPEKDIFQEALFQKSMSLFKKRSSVAEEMRILYVAMTRAKEKLYITAAKSNSEDFCLQGEIPSPFRVINAGSYLDWIQQSGDYSCWKLRTETSDDMTVEEADDYDRANSEYAPLNTPETVTAGEPWRYPYIYEKSLPSKMSVSQIKKRNLDEDAIVLTQDIDEQENNPFSGFMGKIFSSDGSRSFSGAETGTILHECLRRVDYGRCISALNDRENAFDVLVNVFKNLVDEMVAKGFILPDESKAIDFRLPAGFFISSIGKRVLASEKVKREVPFTLIKNAELIEQGTEGKVTIQGIIDCCFIENDGFVIVDYKSDSVFGDAIIKRAQSYKTQLDLYAEALERITGIPVKEKVLFFLRPGVEVRV